VTRDLGGVDKTIWLGWTDGYYSSTSTPVNAPPAGYSDSFSPFGDGQGRFGPGPMGAYTVSLSEANYDRGPLMVLFNTSDPSGDRIWIAYMENSHLEVPPYPANPYGAPNLWTLHSNDSFSSQPELIRVTSDAFPKGHKMADALFVGESNAVYEVFHSNKGELEAVDYNIYLTIYRQGWEVMPDSIGPRVDNIFAIENPFNITSTNFELFATINDAPTGMSPIAGAQYTETSTSIDKSSDVDWGTAIPMSISGNTPIEVANAIVTPVAWIPGEVHRLWVRGNDSAGNWGEGSYLDVLVIGPAGAPPGPPLLMSVELDGVGNADVNLTWSLSSDDGAPGFDGYDVYSGMQYNPGRFNYNLLNPAPLSPGTITYTQAGAGVGNTEDYFYVVVARDINGLRTASPNQGAKLSENYNPGTKLISIPLNMTATDVSTILTTLNYNIAWWYDATDPADHWKSFNPSKPFNDLNSYDRTMALWVQVTADSDLTVAGIVPDTTNIPIFAGWNLIGYPSFSLKEVSDVLSAISYERVEAFDQNSPPDNLRLLGDDDFMTSEGYWVKASAPGTLTIINS
jgi:hypothetical protein